VIRVPYSPGDFKSTFSLTWSWDPQTCETTGLFDGVSDLDLKLIQGYMLHRQEFLGHPLLPHLMLLEALCHFSVNRRNVHQRLLYELEVCLGVTRGYSYRIAEADATNMLNLEQGAVRCNRLRTALVYFERRLTFLTSLVDKIDELLRSPELTVSDPTLPHLSAGSRCFADVVSNSRSFVENQAHLCLCLQKRAQGLNDMVR
jgi:hypothetical protein